MSEDRTLQLVGVALVGFILLALATGVLAAMNPTLGESGPPETEWNQSRINGTHVRITYVEGPPLSTANLVVSVDGYRRDAGWSGRLEPGDSVAVRAAPDRVVRLYWSEGDGPREPLGSWRV